MRFFGQLLAGVCAGIVIAAGVGIRFSPELAAAITDTNTTAWLAALGGAAIGGLISYALARQTSAETLRRDQEQRMAGEHATSLKAMVTAMQISNRNYTLNLTFEKAVADAGPDGPWTALLASTGSGSAPPTFEPTDFIPFINNKRSDLVHRSLLLADRLASIEAAFDAYATLRRDWQTFAGPYTSVNNGAVVTALPQDLVEVAKLRIHEMNNLIGQMLEFSRRDLADAKDICIEMNKSHQEYFGARANFRLEMDEPAPAQK